MLHTTGEMRISRLYKIVPGGPQIYSRSDLVKRHYPASEKDKAREASYLVYSVEEVNEPELKDRVWDISRLSSHQGGRNSALPFVVTLYDLMKAQG